MFQQLEICMYCSMKKQYVEGLQKWKSLLNDGKKNDHNHMVLFFHGKSMRQYLYCSNRGKRGWEWVYETIVTLHETPNENTHSTRETIIYYLPICVY